MTGQPHFSDNKQMDIEDGIEQVFAFVQDVLDEPGILDDLPERATITLTPLPEKGSSVTYETETRNFTVAVD